MLLILCENIVSWLSLNSRKSMVFMQYHLLIVWNKYLLTKNIWYYKTIFSLTTPNLSLKLSIMSVKDRWKSNIVPVTLFIVWKRTQCTALTVQCFYIRRNKGPSVLLSAKNKRVAIKLYEKPKIKSRESVSWRCYIDSPRNHREVLRTT